MNNEFVSYEIALALKELGFDEPCFTYYYNVTGKLRTNISIDIDDIWVSGSIKKLGITLAPTFSQAFKFFRDKYKMAIINPDWNNKYKYIIFNLHLLNQGVLFTKSGFKTYEKAELACLQKMIEILKKDN